MPDGRPFSVVMLTQTFHPVVGGSERQAFELSRALALRGVNVTVLTRGVRGCPAAETMDGIHVRRLGTSFAGPLDHVLFMVWAFSWLLFKRAAYDAVHVHLASSAAVAAVVAGRLTGRRTVVKLGGGKGVDEITLSRGTFLGRLKLAFFRLASAELLVMNSEVLEWLRSEPEYASFRARLFRNGVDTGRFTPPLYNEKINAKSAAGFDNSLMFLFVGRLSPEKRVREFVEVWAEIFSEERVKPQARLVIVGGGPEEAALRRAVAGLGLGQSVTLTGPKQDLLPYYRAADVFILPSISEGLSNSMLEAMSCGLAVMASRVGGARDAVEQEVSGMLFDPLNRQEIKDCLKRFMSERTLSVKLGGAARRTAVEKYSMARVTDDLMEMYGGADRPAAVGK